MSTTAWGGITVFIRMLVTISVLFYVWLVLLLGEQNLGYLDFNLF